MMEFSELPPQHQCEMVELVRVLIAHAQMVADEQPTGSLVSYAGRPLRPLDVPPHSRLMEACGTEMAFHRLLAAQAELLTTHTAQPLTWREADFHTYDGDAWALTPVDGAPDWSQYVARERVVGPVWRVNRNRFERVQEPTA